MKSSWLQKFSWGESGVGGLLNPYGLWLPAETGGLEGVPDNSWLQQCDCLENELGGEGGLWSVGVAGSNT